MGQYYRVATISTLYLTVSEIIIKNLKSKGQSNMSFEQKIKSFSAYKTELASSDIKYIWISFMIQKLSRGVI